MNWTDEQLAETERICEAATERPWVYDEVSWTLRHGNVSGTSLLSLPSRRISRHDAANLVFAAHARTALPSAVEEMRRLRAELAEQQRRLSLLLPACVGMVEWFGGMGDVELVEEAGRAIDVARRAIKEAC